VVRRDLRSTLSGYDGVTVLVTHDPVDAYALADRVLVLESGHVAQGGSLAAVTAHPRSRYVADLVGLNLLRGEMDHGVLVLAEGARIVTVDDGLSGPAFATVRPQSVSLAPHTARRQPA